MLFVKQLITNDYGTKKGVLKNTPFFIDHKSLIPLPWSVMRV